MSKQRAGARLSDLNLPGRAFKVVGVEYAEDGTAGEVVTHLYARKLSPDEHDLCVKKGQAARARVTLAFKNPESEESLALLDKVEQYSDDTLVAYLMQDHRRKAMQVVEAQLLGDKDSEWAQDDYLVGLRNAWLGDAVDDVPGLKERYAEDPDDPEALRVLNELSRFGEQANNRIERMMKDVEDELEGLPREQLKQRVIDEMQKVEAHAAWIVEYDLWQVALGTRKHDPTLPKGHPHPEHRERYFEGGRVEVGETDMGLIQQILDVFQAITVDIQSGKGSRPGPTSSPPSETRDEPVMVQPSTLRAVTV